MELTLSPSDASPVDFFANAHTLAVACNFSYLKADDAKRKFLNDLGIEGELLSTRKRKDRTDSQVFVGVQGKNIVAAFRGSEAPTTEAGIRDWVDTNFDHKMVPPEADSPYADLGVDAQLHSGFYKAVDAVWKQLSDTIAKRIKDIGDDYTIWLTGHSLGGALATLAAWRLEQEDAIVHRVYTYAAPMVFNIAGASEYNRYFLNSVFRFVTEQDIVPRLPITSILDNEYQQVGMENVLRAQAPRSSPASKFFELASSLANLVNISLNNFLPFIVGAVRNRLEAHSLDRAYIPLIEAERKKLE